MQVMETRKPKLGPEHPDTMTSMAADVPKTGQAGRGRDPEGAGDVDSED